MRQLLEVSPKVAWLAQMETIYLSGFAPDFVARRHGFRNAYEMHVAFEFAWELGRFLESVGLA